MDTFLAHLSHYLKRNYGDSLSENCIVLPNKRAGLFLKIELHKCYGKAIWLPEIITIEELITLLSGFETIDPIELQLEFHKIFNQISPEKQSIEEFLKWSPSLLNDFNEMDHYLVDAKAMFSFVNETRAIEVWNVEGGQLTDYQKKYLLFWKQLFPLYQTLSNYLRSKKTVYSGLAFRQVAENMEQLLTEGKLNKWNHLVFAGFNALNNAEQQIVKTLEKSKKAVLLFDTDKFYIDNPLHDAGLFIRKYTKSWLPKNYAWKFDNFITKEKKIEVIGVPGTVNQTKFAGELLQQYTHQNLEKTAVVLADENLLIPLLYSLPTEINQVNITMGYSVQYTPFYAFVNNLFNLQINAQREGKEVLFHHKDVFNILESSLWQSDTEIKDNFKGVALQIRKNNLTFLSSKELLSALKKIESPEIINLWKPCRNGKEAIKITAELLRYFTTKNRLENYTDVEKQVFGLFNELIIKMDNLLQNYQLKITVKGIWFLMRQMASQINIAFYGEPLNGLQIMGMLETRNLDFDNVIVLSVNESILPAGKGANSFVPQDIKQQFGLPNYKEKDAIFTYHFFRLLQRAKNIHLLYSSETDSLGKGEKSRFITQLEYELSKNTGKINLQYKTASFPLVQPNKRTLSINKKEVNEQLQKILTTGISPSAINTYLKCPLDFYFKYLLRFHEANKVETQMEASTFGETIHYVLEQLYLPYLNKIITPEAIDTMIPKIEKLTEQNFLNTFSKRDLYSGKNYLSFSIAVKYLHSFLTLEKQFIHQINQKGEHLTLLYLEEKLEQFVEVNNQKIKLKGTVDRIDKIGNTVRIVDYKSGLVEQKNVAIKEIEFIFEDEKWSKALQLLFYAFLCKDLPIIKGKEVVAGNISFRKLSTGFLPFTYNKITVIDAELISEFELGMQQIINNILNFDTPFEHREGAKYCGFCTAE